MRGTILFRERVNAATRLSRIIRGASKQKGPKTTEELDIEVQRERKKGLSHKGPGSTLDPRTAAWLRCCEHGSGAPQSSWKVSIA